MTPDYECDKQNLNDESEGAETVNNSNPFHISIVLGTNEYIYELVRAKGACRVSDASDVNVYCLS